MKTLRALRGRAEVRTEEEQAKELYLLMEKAARAEREISYAAKGEDGVQEPASVMHRQALEEWRKARTRFGNLLAEIR